MFLRSPIACPSCGKIHEKSEKDFLFIQSHSSALSNARSSRFYFNEIDGKYKLTIFCDLLLMNQITKKPFIKKAVPSSLIYSKSKRLLFSRSVSVFNKQNVGLSILSFANSIESIYESFNISAKKITTLIDLRSSIFKMCYPLNSPSLTSRMYYYKNCFLPLKKFTTALESEMPEHGKLDIAKVDKLIKNKWIKFLSNQNDCLNTSLTIPFGEQADKPPSTFEIECSKRIVKTNLRLAKIQLLNLLNLYPAMATILFSTYGGDINKFCQLIYGLKFKKEDLNRKNPSNPRTIINEIFKAKIRHLANDKDVPYKEVYAIRRKIEKFSIHKNIFNFIVNRQLNYLNNGECDFFNSIAFYLFMSICQENDNLNQGNLNNILEKMGDELFTDFVISCQRGKIKNLTHNNFEHFCQINSKERSDNGGRGRDLVYTYTDLLRMISMLNFPMSRVLECKTHDELLRLHDECSSMIEIKHNEKYEQEIKEHVKNFTHLNTETDQYQFKVLDGIESLIHESKKMHHCIKTYVDRIRKKTYLGIHIENIENPKDCATLGLICDPEKNLLFFEQLKSFHNNHSTDHMIMATKKFMDDQAISYLGKENSYDLRLSTESESTKGKTFVLNPFLNPNRGIVDNEVERIIYDGDGFRYYDNNDIEDLPF
jgi:hypothetical protein